jgi:hypothetical protein
VTYLWRMRPIAALVGVVSLIGCAAPGVTSDLAFIVAAGDSTFLVEASASDVQVHRAPVLLARLDSAFHELYLVDRDFSFHDAMFIGQAVYRRNLVTGDSVLVWEDRRIREVALAWRRRHPGEVPLAPDEEGSEDPTTQASTETELLDVVGPYMSYELHLDIDAEQEPHEHLTRRGVIDIRTGHHVTLSDLTDSVTAHDAIEHGRRSFRAAIDSVRRTTDARAARARELVDGFHFDATSFELVEVDGNLVASFYAPGSGARVGGYALPHGDASLGRAPWMREVIDTRPTTYADDRLEWQDSVMHLVATVRTTGESAALEFVRGRQRRHLTDVPTPVLRVFRLRDDRVQRDALRRVFTEWSPTTATPTNARPRSVPRRIPSI